MWAYHPLSPAVVPGAGQMTLSPFLAAAETKRPFLSPNKRAANLFHSGDLTVREILFKKMDEAGDWARYLCPHQLAIRTARGPKLRIADAWTVLRDRHRLDNP
jgi:hypothetical protein